MYTHLSELGGVETGPALYYSKEDAGELIQAPGLHGSLGRPIELRKREREWTRAPCGTKKNFKRLYILRPSNGKDRDRK